MRLIRIPMPDSKYVHLRRFLLAAFADHELMDFCFDYFPVVYNDLGESMRKSQKARALLDYCARQGRMADLAAALKRERPAGDLEQLLRTSLAEALPALPVLAPRDLRQIFVSHAHQDAAIAQHLAADLRSAGWRIWIAPDSMRPGEKWVEAINRGLDESGVFLLLLSPHAVASRWVKSETDVAIELEHEGLLQFIPLQMAACALPPMWRVYQRLNFAGRYETAFAELLARLDEGRPQ